MGQQPLKWQDRGWVYPPMEYAMVEAGFHEVDTYVSCHQNTVAQYIATRSIMDLCLAEKLRLGTRVAMWWRKQEGLDLKGMRTEAQ